MADAEASRRKRELLAAELSAYFQHARKKLTAWLDELLKT
jgi:hypothetical protein